MKTHKLLLTKCLCKMILGLFVTLPAIHRAGAATITNVTVGDNFFNPPNVRISVSDGVRWTWNGNNPHSTTSNGGLWNSGNHVNGFIYTNFFSAAGTFPYHCNVHGTQTGSVVVQAPANNPPTVAINTPTNGAVFAGPWTGPIQATASDTDGTISKVDFYRGTTLMGTVTSAGPSVSFTVTNLAAGTYQLKAVATDNLGGTNGSAVVTVSVVTPAPILITSPQRTGPNTFQFTYSTTAGLRYVVRKTTTLSNWTAVVTNLAAGTSLPFSDNVAAGSMNFYSVMVAPNP